MPAKLTTTITKIQTVPNLINSAIIHEFYQYMTSTDSSIHHKNNNLKVIIAFANFLGSDVTFHEVKKKEQVLAFLNTKVKDSNSDPEKRWITTWNHYLNRIRLPNAIKNIQKDTAICLSYDLSIQCSRG